MTVAGTAVDLEYKYLLELIGSHGYQYFADPDNGYYVVYNFGKFDEEFASMFTF